MKVLGRRIRGSLVAQNLAKLCDAGISGDCGRTGRLGSEDRVTAEKEPEPNKS